MEPNVILGRVRTRLQRVVALSGAARVIAVVLGAAGAAVLADRIWFLPGWLRLGLLLGISACVCLVIWRRLLRPLRRPLSDRDVATFLERRLPALNGRLLSVVDGIAMSPRDITAITAAMPETGERDLVRGSRLPRLLSIATVAIILALGAALVSPPFWRDGLARLVLPLADHDWERNTILSGSVERRVVASDEQAVVLIQRERGAAGVVRLAWDDSHGNAAARQLAGSSGPWRQAIALTPGNWNLTVTSDDAHPLRLAVLVVDRPRLERATATLIPPAYSDLPTQQMTTPACQALAGSRLELRLQVEVPGGRQLAGVSANFGDTVIPLSQHGGDWIGSIMVNQAADLVVQATDVDEIALSPAARFPIAVEPDRIPSVSLSGPRAGEAVGPRAKVAVTIEASDDLGLAQLEVTVASALPGTAASAPSILHQDHIAGRRTLQRRLLVDVATHAGPGGTITLLGRATDRNDISGPGVGTSQPLVLKVVAEDELRRDLERQLSEARDRIIQARAALTPGIGDDAKRPAAARAASQDAARAADLLARILRRWSENALESDRVAPATEAQQAVSGEATPALAAAANGDAQAARQADAGLERGERALDRMLSDSDLTRIIAQIIEREKSLHVETKHFVKEHLTIFPDETGKSRQIELANRQRELASRTSEAERRILSGPSTLDPVKEILRSSGPATRLEQAAVDTGSTDQRPRALQHQTAAIDALERVLAALRGGDANADLGRRLGELAERQDRLAETLEDGANLESTRQDQERLRQETERLAGELKDKTEAQEPTQAAANAQAAAEKDMQQGRRSAAANAAATAAELLRQAQRKLDPRSQEDENKNDATDVVVLLRRLYSQQVKVLANSLPIAKRIGEDAPDFAATRDLVAIAQLQDDILLRLREEGIKLLDRHPIAKLALTRVDTSLSRVLTHLQLPALGESGLRLERIAVAELKRLIDIVDNLPNGPDDGSGGGGGGGGEGNQAPFPPAAEIALLMDIQAEIYQRVASGRPGDLNAAQGDLTKAVELFESTTRPGSRPHVLFGRTRRATNAAALLLKSNDRGANVRNHMVTAEEHLRQILLEAKSSGGGGGKEQQQKPKPSDNNEPPPPAGASAAAAAGANSGTAPPSAAAATAVRAEQNQTNLLQLPPERREQLRQAREQRLPAGAMQLFERYLERLEEP